MKNNKKKENILKTTIELFKTYGIENTSVNMIVKKAKIAKGTFFYYYEKKENIVFEIIENEFNNYLFIPEEIIKEKEINAKEKMQKVLLSLFSVFKTTSLLEEIFKFGIELNYEKFIKELRLKKIIPVIKTIINEGNNEGTFDVKNVDIISSIIVRGIIEYIHLNYENLKNEEILSSMFSSIEELLNNVLKTSERIIIY